MSNDDERDYDEEAYNQHLLDGEHDEPDDVLTDSGGFPVGDPRASQAPGPAMLPGELTVPGGKPDDTGQWLQPVTDWRDYLPADPPGPPQGGHMVPLLPPERHADYPHEPGRLFDCRACESRCHCTAGHTECVYSGEHNGLAAQDSEHWAPRADVEEALMFVRNHPLHHGQERRQYEAALKILGSGQFSAPQTQHIAYELTRILAGR